MLPEPSSWRRYALAVGAIVIAVALTPWVRPVLPSTPFLLCLLATLFSAGYGGIGPALVAGGLGLGLVEVLFLIPEGTTMSPSEVRRLLVFLAALLLLGWQSSARRRARADLRFLAEASAGLGASLDVQTTRTTARGLAVPHLADACFLTLPGDPRPDLGPFRECVDIPLQSHGVALGTLTLVRYHWWKRPIPRAVAQELGQRVALALDNARLYEAAVEMREALRGRAEELATLDRRKDLFLAVLAHEMCGPLSALNTLARVMTGHKGQPAPVAWEMVTRQLDVLTRLAEDLLDLVRLVQGKAELRRSPVSLADVVGDAVTATTVLTTERHQTVTIQIPPEHLILEVDRVRLAQVLTNLLTNSSKYTPFEGHITLTVVREKDGILLTVRDNGIGMDSDLLPRVFDLFTQGDEAAKLPGGLGLGLALVRHLVELHGGTVEAQSAGPGQGSAFQIHLPNCVVNTPPPPSTTAPVLQAPHRPAILVVDDSRDMVGALTLILETAGYVVLRAHDGAGALRMAEEGHPRIVLLDINLPDVTGYDVARALKASPQGTGMTVVALSGYAHDEHRRRCREAGFDHQMAKPVDPDDLLAWLQDLSVR